MHEQRQILMLTPALPGASGDLPGYPMIDFKAMEKLEMGDEQTI